MILTSAWSAGYATPPLIVPAHLTDAYNARNTYLWSSSRTLYSLALQNQAPRFLTKLTKQGVPWICVLVCWAVGLLSFLSAGSGGASAAFQWLQNLTALAALNAWCEFRGGIFFGDAESLP